VSQWCREGQEVGLVYREEKADFRFGTGKEVVCKHLTRAQKRNIVQERETAIRKSHVFEKSMSFSKDLCSCISSTNRALKFGRSSLGGEERHRASVLRGDRERRPGFRNLYPHRGLVYAGGGCVSRYLGTLGRMRNLFLLMVGGGKGRRKT